MANEVPVTCGDVDGKGTPCRLWRPTANGWWCDVLCGLITERDPCHCLDARRAALLAQLSEQDREALEVGEIMRELPERYAVYHCAADRAWWILNDRRDAPVEAATLLAALREWRRQREETKSDE